MRIVWHSAAAWAPTGYGSQTALFAPRIRDQGHEVVLSAFWGLQGAVWEWEGMPVYPMDDHWGNVYLPEIVKRHSPCQVITLMDAWVLNPKMLEQFPELACWVPIDHAPITDKVAQVLRESRCRPIAMSKFGLEELQREGLDALYVPHGVDTSVYKPAADHGAAREQVGFPNDAFVVGMVANNTGRPSRKGFPEALAAFSEFQRRHNDAFLYLHCDVTGGTGNKQGLNLPRLMDSLAIPPASVGFVNQFDYAVGNVPEPAMAALYNSMDVLLNPSYGEGFGIPIIEAQACGTPVIVTDWTSMPELCGAGWVVGGQPFYDGMQESYFLAPSIDEILQALEDAYENAGNLRGQAREFALAYDADRVTEEFWKPTLEALARPREIPPLNRAQRRAKAKVTKAKVTA